MTLATWLLTYATTYPQFLLAALGVGIAGGTFAVGVTYVSKFYSSARQGTALGIFGAGFLIVTRDLVFPELESKIGLAWVELESALKRTFFEVANACIGDPKGMR